MRIVPTREGDISSETRAIRPIRRPLELEARGLYEGKKQYKERKYSQLFILAARKTTYSGGLQNRRPHLPATRQRQQPAHQSERLDNRWNRNQKLHTTAQCARSLLLPHSKLEKWKNENYEKHLNEGGAVATERMKVYGGGTEITKCRTLTAPAGPSIMVMSLDPRERHFP